MFKTEFDVIDQIISKIKLIFERTNWKKGYITLKSDNDFVTHIDMQINRIIVDLINQNFPNDGLLSEETEDDGDRLNRKRTWIIDPLDGTGNLVHVLQGKSQKKYFNVGVHLGLVINGIAQLGFVFLPFKNELFYAIKGKGAFKKTDNGNDIRLKIIKDINLKSEFAQSIFENPLTINLPNQMIGEKESFGNVFGCCILGIVENKISSYFAYPLNKKRIGEWDVCAPGLILQEAGGLITDFEGNEFVFNNLNPYISSGIIAKF